MVALTFGAVIISCDNGDGNNDAATSVLSVQPLDATYGDGDAADALTVTASVSDGRTLTYQWFRNTANSADGGTAISGATQAAYTPSIAANGTIYYYVVVTNINHKADGAKTATKSSRVAKIEKVAGSVTHAATPVLTVQPASALTVTASVSDGGILTYQWFKNTANSADGGTAIDGATQASYTPPTATRRGLLLRDCYQHQQ
ncbi:MAG: hypothetical protein LBD58_12740 [Treponema sp.]|jgi:hypothetical protein|nr:hypothetical protein [Treponema sp.]